MKLFSFSLRIWNWLDRSLILCQVNSKVVVFISIVYTHGFLHLFPATILPSYFHLQLSYLQTFSSIIFPFPYIVYSTLFHRLDRFSGSSFPMSSLPASDYSILSSVHQSSRLVLPYPLSFPFLPPEPPSFLTARVIPPPPHKNVTRSHSPLCCITLARGHRETAKTCADIVGYFNSVCPQCNSIRKMTSRSAFLMCRTRTGGHSSKYWPSERLLDLGDSLAPTTHRILSVLILKYVLRNFWNSINQHCKIPKSKIQKFQCFKNSY